jgi:CcmD family protein
MTFRWRVSALYALVLGLVLQAGQVWLQAQAPEGFVQMSREDMAQETIPAAPLVLAAYSIVWVALLAYVFLLWRRLGRVERELADVTTQLRAVSKD